MEASHETMVLLESFALSRIHLYPKLYIHLIFSKESRKSTVIFDNDSVSINILVCVILNMIASSRSFLQRSPIMTCLIQIGKYFCLIHLFKIALTIILNRQIYSALLRYPIVIFKQQWKFTV